MDWVLVSVLVVACMPGVILAVPRSLDTLLETATEGEGSEGKADLPPYPVLVALAAVQSTALVALAAVVGAYTAPAVGLGAPAFDAVLGAGAVWPAFAPQLLPAATAGFGGGVVFLLAYYGVVRPRLDERSVTVMEDTRTDIGVLGRVLYGGVAEEVIARWGLTSLIAWLGLQVLGETGPVVVWAAIVAAGVLFALGHLPSYFGAGCRKTPTFLAAVLFLNVWISVVAGWLFWRYGLEAAIVSHALVHVLWIPLDYRATGTSLSGRPTGRLP
jgi:hypothetical protein